MTDTELLHYIDREFHLEMTGEPVPLSGGFMHRMYALETEKGKLAVKLLNPHVMEREDAMSNYALAERLEKRLEEHGIPILPALTIHGRKMQEVTLPRGSAGFSPRYFYLFDYFEGRPVQGDSITAYHCREMGKVLARIHGIEVGESGEEPEQMHIDWDFYAEALKERDRELYRLLQKSMGIILESQEEGNRARRRLPRISAICHNDMDSKNVLWRGDGYRIIDLECMSYGNPQMELYELALCWSGYETCHIDFRLFHEFLDGYAEAGGALPEDWETLYACSNGRLEWLEYNIKRVLGIDCGSGEREMGIRQVRETLAHIEYYAKIKERISWEL